MSLKKRINRLVKTLFEKNFYHGENLEPGKFTPEVIVAIESFRDNAPEGYHTRVVINAFRVFDGHFFDGVKRNCSSVTDLVKDGINACIKKYFIDMEKPVINYGFPEFMNQGSFGIAVRAISGFFLNKNIASKELELTHCLADSLSDTVKKLQRLSGISTDGNFGPATQRAFKEVFDISPSELLNGDQGFTFAVHPDGHTVIYQHVPQSNSAEATA